MGARVVLDTNVIVSGLGWRGPSHDIVQSCLDLQHDLVLSSALLMEIERVLRYPKFVQDDPADNRVLECALAGGAQVIVSGDRHLLDLAELEKIPILRPRAFLDRYKGS